MKKLMLLAAAAVIASASFACCCNNSNKCSCSIKTVVTTNAVTNCVCVCHSGQTCTVDGCSCDCHGGCKCCCHTRCTCKCCQCGCSASDGVETKEFNCGNRFVGFNITVTRFADPPPPPPPAQRLPPQPGQFIGQPQQLPPAPPTAMPAQVNQPGQPPQYAPVVPSYQTWVEGRYAPAVTQSGHVTRVWIPGHYESCQLIGQ